MSLLSFLLILVILFLFWPRVQTWLLVRLLQRVQRRMSEATGQQQYYDPRGGRQAPDSDCEAPASTEERQKQQLDNIEARKFDRSSSDDYVDFEELPKD